MRRKSELGIHWTGRMYFKATIWSPYEARYMSAYPPPEVGRSSFPVTPLMNSEDGSLSHDADSLRMIRRAIRLCSWAMKKPLSSVCDTNQLGVARIVEIFTLWTTSRKHWAESPLRQSTVSSADSEVKIDRRKVAIRSPSVRRAVRILGSFARPRGTDNCKVVESSLTVKR